MKIIISRLVLKEAVEFRIKENNKKDAKIYLGGAGTVWRTDMNSKYILIDLADLAAQAGCEIGDLDPDETVARITKRWTPTPINNGWFVDAINVFKPI